MLKFNVACAMTAGFFKAQAKDKYRRLGSNQRPRGYETRALPLRHSGKRDFAHVLRRLSYDGLVGCFCKAAEV